MTPPVLHTDRLTLRGHVIGDFEPYATMFSSVRAQYMGQLKRRHAWYSFTSDVAQWTLLGIGAWAIESRADQKFLGQVAIMQPDHFPEPELGWFLMEDAEGHGFASEAARKVLSWWWARPEAGDGFGVATGTLVSYIDPANDRSIALATRLGACEDPDATLPEGETAEETTVYRHRRPS